MNNSVCIFGGSFNPVHIGHLALADAVRAEFGYDMVIFMPAYQNPFKDKPYEVSVQDRIEMLRLAVQGNEKFIVDTFEAERTEPSYTIDTVSHIIKKYGVKPGLIIGDDLAPSFLKWREAQKIADQADVIVGRRMHENGCTADLEFPHRMLENSVLPISSSDIRSRIYQGKSWRYLVSEPVYRYIYDRNLYERKHQ